MPRFKVCVQVVIQVDLDVDKFVEVEQCANLARFVMLHVEIEDVQHSLHDDAAVVLLARGRKLGNLV